MTTPPSVLLLDDGELDDVAAHLRSHEIPFTRLSGGEIHDGLAPPLDLLVASPRRASAVRRGSPAGARPGRPVRIIVVEEDSNAMRRMLRRMGFHLLVRRPTHPEIWRLLVQRALFQGEERRGELRVPVGSHVDVQGAARVQRAVLADLTSRGCLLLSQQALEPDTCCTVEIPGRATGGEPLALSGRLERATHDAAAAGAEPFAAALVFDEDLPDATRIRLQRLLASWSNGGALCEAEAASAAQRPEAIEVSLHADEANENRRSNARANFRKVVRAEAAGESRVLMGRDLSVGGMRVERLTGLAVGDAFTLAIYGPSQDQPFRVAASVIRHDEDGLALAFHDVPRETAAELEKLVACLPDVESLEETEAEGLGSVITEIVDRVPDESPREGE